GAQALGDQLADPAEADDADGLLQQLDAGELLALPATGLDGGVGPAQVAQRGEDQRDRELRGGDDVRGGGVDHHDARGGGGVHVDVVQAHAGAGDDLELGGGGVDLGIDLGRGADQQGVGVRDRGQQRRPVGAVDIPDLDLGPQDLDG